MNVRMQYQMERASRVLRFSREHPSDIPGYDLAVKRLEERLTRFQELAAQETAGLLESRGFVADSKALIALISADLRLLGAIARTAGMEVAGTPKRIRYPGPRLSHVQFVTGARGAVAEARDVEELLVKFGLPPQHLDTLAARLDRLEALHAERGAAVDAHITARHSMAALTRELGVVLKQLNAINRHRFLEDAAIRESWRTVQRLRGSTRPAERDAGSGADQVNLTPIALPPGQPQM